MPKLRNTKRKVDKFHPINCPIFGCKTIIKHSINLKRHIIIVFALYGLSSNVWGQNCGLRIIVGLRRSFR